jgi:hypothetical protein
VILKALGTDQARTASESPTDFAEETQRGNSEDTGPAVEAAGKSKGRGAKEAGEPQKEGYVHVRARSGQATNSHSIAEKVPYFKVQTQQLSSDSRACLGCRNQVENSSNLVEIMKISLTFCTDPRCFRTNIAEPDNCNVVRS